MKLPSREKTSSIDILHIPHDEYYTSNLLYMVEAMLEYFIALAVSGAILAKLTTSLGISDSLTGIISSFVSLGCAFQILAIFLFRRANAKKPIVIIQLINDLLFGFVFFIPLLSLDGNFKITLFIAAFFIAYFLMNIISAPKRAWLLGLIDENSRGIFSAEKEILSLIGGMLFSLAAGKVIDVMEAKGNLRGAFVVCGVAVMVLTVLHILSLCFIKQRPEAIQQQQKAPSLKKLLGNKVILKILFVGVLWNVAAYAATPFYGTYQISELHFSMTFVSVLSMIASLARALISPRMGHFADKKGFATMMSLCFLIAAAAFAMNVFARPENGKFFFTAYSILHAISMAGINNGLMNLVFDYVEPELRKDTLALHFSLSGVVGFFSTLAFSPLVAHIQAQENHFLGIQVYAQQVVSLFAVIMILLVALFTRTAFRNEKKLRGEPTA